MVHTRGVLLHYEGYIYDMPERSCDAALCLLTLPDGRWWVIDNLSPFMIATPLTSTISTKQRLGLIAGI